MQPANIVSDCTPTWTSSEVEDSGAASVTASRLKITKEPANRSRT